MSAAMANRICAALPGAVLEHPFGPGTDTWKVGGKIFALVGDGGGATPGVSLKCRDRDTAAFLIEIGVAGPAPYLHRHGWIRLNFEGLDPAELDLRLRQSHAAVVAGLPKRLRPDTA